MATNGQRRRGRPAIGPLVRLRLDPDVLAAVDRQAADLAIPRAERLRRIITDHTSGADMTTTVEDLAAEVNPSDPGAGVKSVIGFLGHLSGLTADSVLADDDVADVRNAWATQLVAHISIDSPGSVLVAEHDADGYQMAAGEVTIDAPALYADPEDLDVDPLAMADAALAARGYRRVRDWEYGDGSATVTVDRA